MGQLCGAIKEELPLLLGDLITHTYGHPNYERLHSNVSLCSQLFFGGLSRPDTADLSVWFALAQGKQLED